MSALQLVLVDSFFGTSIFSFSLETAWFAAKEFGTHNIFLVTAVAFLGAVAAMTATCLIGYAAARVRHKVFHMDEEIYHKIRDFALRYGVYIFLFQMMPVVKILFLFAGLLSLPFKRVLMFMLAGRAFYYVYYLYILPHLPYYHSMF